jgi:hypothetical protein
VSDTADPELFMEAVRQSVVRRVGAMDTEELLNVLGFIIQRERRKSAEEPPPGLYPIQ